MINFSIIIPNFNGAKFLSDCINSIYQAIRNCPQSNFEIIIVDNASKDNSLKLFQSQIKKLGIKNIQIHRLKKNMGFAVAVNYGICRSQFDWLVIMNNDLTIEPNCFNLISNHLDKLNKTNLAAIFGTILNKEGNQIESQGLNFFISGKAQNINNGQVFQKSIINNLKPKFVWGASAALIVYQKSILQKVGSFDASFFAYIEDVDLALRLNKLKYKTFYVPQAISYHLGGGTTNKLKNFRFRMVVKNWIYLIIKDYSKKEILDNLFPIVLERLHNLSGLIKQTIKIYKFKSIYRLPIDLFKTYGEIIIRLPSLIRKHKQFQKLIQSINL